MFTRRTTLAGMLGLVAAPAIVRFTSIMPVKSLGDFFVDDEGMPVFVGETYWQGARQYRVRKVTENGFVVAEVINFRPDGYTPVVTFNSKGS